MAGILVSPCTDLRIRKRSSLYKKRNESPKFRDILRARCHARIKASRCALIDKFRNLKDSDELHSTLSNILREEASVLTAKEFFSSSLPDEEILDGSEEDQWLMEEYEKILREEEAHFSSDWESQVICPLCEMSVLQLDEGSQPTCPKCRVSLPRIESLHDLRGRLDADLYKHSENCDAVANFALLDNSELNGLFLICGSCLYFSQVL